MSTPLDEELAFYEAELPELLKHHEGKFVVIKGRHLVGTFDTAESAYEHGVRTLGNVAMLIREVRRTPAVEFIPNVLLA